MPQGEPSCPPIGPTNRALLSSNAPSPSWSGSCAWLILSIKYSNITLDLSKGPATGGSPILGLRPHGVSDARRAKVAGAEAEGQKDSPTEGLRPRRVSDARCAEAGNSMDFITGATVSVSMLIACRFKDSERHMLISQHHKQA